MMTHLSITSHFFPRSLVPLTLLSGSLTRYRKHIFLHPFGKSPLLQALEGLGFPHGSEIKASVCSAKTRVQSLGWEDPLEKEMITHSSILAWEMDRGTWWTTIYGVAQSRTRRK